MDRRVLKWVVPADDKDHPIGGGPVVLVDVQTARAGHLPTGVVTVWTDEPDVGAVDLRSARVFGTGQPVPGGDEHIGSCQDGPLVWHVFASSRPSSRPQEVSDV